MIPDYESLYLIPEDLYRYVLDKCGKSDKKRLEKLNPCESKYDRVKHEKRDAEETGQVNDAEESSQKEERTSPPPLQEKGTQNCQVVPEAQEKEERARKEKDVIESVIPNLSSLSALL